MDIRERPAGDVHRHPWEIARFEFLSDILMKRISPDRASQVLDAGAGDGWFASRLAVRLPPGSVITCWDRLYTQEDISELSSGAPDAIRFRSEEPDGRFDAVLLLDVLEHVQDDLGFLSSIVEDHLEPGGLALVTVPAWPALFSRHDAALRHHRRYTPAACLSLLEASGLAVERSGGLFHSLLVPRAVQKIEERVPGHEPGPVPNLGDWRHGNLVTGLLVSALRFDNLFSHLFARTGVHVPGTSFWVLSRK